MSTPKSNWNGDIKTGSDLRLWRRSLGLYLHEFALLLHVTPSTLRRAKKNQQPGARIMDGVQLVRTKILLGSLHVDEVRRNRLQRGRPKKEQINRVVS
jgi:transcriptional regulator with XRE-family HTH domain